MAKGVFKRSLFGYRRAEVDDAISRRDHALEEEGARAFELEQASLGLAAQVESLEQLADRLAMRVVERERHIAELSARLDVAIDALRNPDARIEDVDGAAEAGDGEEPGAVFDGTIEVEVGPLSDFGQLASFEDAAGGIDAADEIAVKGFADGRATLEMHLSEPIELLRELEERAPFEFTVRDTRGDRVVLDVDTDAA